MPHKVIKRVKVTQLLENDVILADLPTEPDLTVTARPNVKTKYTYVSYSADGISGQIPFLKSAEVNVSREEPTEEEQAAATRRQAIAWARESLDRAIAALTDAKNKLAGSLDARDVNWHGQYWANYAEAQIELGLWEYVHKVAEKQEIDLYDAMIAVRDEVTKRLLDLGHVMPRSTSMLRNYCDALESEVRLRFVRDVNWHV